MSKGENMVESDDELSFPIGEYMAACRGIMEAAHPTALTIEGIRRQAVEIMRRRYSRTILSQPNDGK